VDIGWRLGEGLVRIAAVVVLTARGADPAVRAQNGGRAVAAQSGQ